MKSEVVPSFSFELSDEFKHLLDADQHTFHERKFRVLARDDDIVEQVLHLFQGLEVVVYMDSESTTILVFIVLPATVCDIKPVVDNLDGLGLGFALGVKVLYCS